MWKNLDIYSRKSTIKPHVTLHSTWNAHTCTLFSHSKNNMWMYVEKFKHDSKNPHSNPVWPYIPHEMHMLAHYFHTTRSTCGYMWKNVNMNSKKKHSQIPCGITFHMKCTCSHIIINNNNNIYLKSSIQTSSIDYKNYYGMYKYNKYDYTNRIVIIING